MFKNIIVYRIAEGWEVPAVAAIEEGLGLNRFAECGPTQTESKGWVEPRGVDHGALVEAVGGHMVLKLRSQCRVLPGSVIKEEVEKRAKKIAEETGQKVGRAKKAELKELVKQELLPRAFTKTATTLVWIDPKSRFLVVGAGSQKKADVVTTAVIEAFSEIGNSLMLTGLSTQVSPSKAMSGWLHSQEPPSGFSVDRECELRSTEGEGATVRYNKHTLEIKEVVEHIEQGKEATKLAMTWGNRVSFMLGADLGIKKIEMLETAIKDASTQAAGDRGDDNFDSDVAITTGELSMLIPDLIEALGGELEQGQPSGEAVDAAAPADVAELEAA